MEISELKRILQEHFNKIYNEENEEEGEADSEDLIEMLRESDGETIEGLGKIDIVEDDIEGRDDTYFVTYFKDLDIYLKTEGYYQSYDGTTWDEGWGTQVYPKVIEKTIYTTKKS
jgi:hypothetical protein